MAAVGLVPLLALTGKAATPEQIREAIDRGVAYLKQQQQPGGGWAYGQSNPHDYTIGVTALAGLTLLECGIPANDAHVSQAAAAVRGATPQLSMTYALLLSILFLDRLGDPADEELIDSLAVRLLAGQSMTSGGWAYACPPPSDAEVRRLRTLVEQRSELVARAELPPKGKRRAEDLPKEIQAQLRQLQQGAAGAGRMRGDDNSNTQFATLALWVARRQGMPVEAALARLDRRFRLTQGQDGGWAYSAAAQLMGPTGEPAPNLMPGAGGASTATMTCAGLLGLAVSYGCALDMVQRAAKSGDKTAAAVGKKLNPGKDLIVRRGLLALGTCVGRPLAAAGPQPPLPRISAQENGRGYYFLWSLERVAAAYGLDTLGDQDWYAWGADVLLRNQSGDGSWRGDYAMGGCDTCFALLFLRRANLAQDLTAILKARVSDPGKRELRAGGVGGEGLMKGAGLKPAFETGDSSRDVTTGGDKVAPQVGRLAAELVGAEDGKEAEVLGRLRDGKGAAYTQALAQAIPKLTGEARAKARDALADRLKRMTAATLADKLGDEDAEIRRAAALAAAMKDERSHVPRLIELLSDPEPPVARAAHAALKSLTGQDLGPEPDATRADIAQAVQRWKDWWRKNGDK
jgi:hypothetical protein